MKKLTVTQTRTAVTKKAKGEVVFSKNQIILLDPHAMDEGWLLTVLFENHDDEQFEIEVGEYEDDEIDAAEKHANNIAKHMNQRGWNFKVEVAR